MVLLKEKVRSEKFYSIEYSTSMKKYLLASLVQDKVLYSRYFEITEKEYNYHKKKLKKLDEIALQCAEQGISSTRYLCSDKSEENSHDQQRIWDRLLGESAAYDFGNSFERI